MNMREGEVRGTPTQTRAFFRVSKKCTAQTNYRAVSKLKSQLKYKHKHDIKLLSLLTEVNHDSASSQPPRWWMAPAQRPPTVVGATTDHFPLTG
jgi:hypothetical protein